MYFFKDLRAVVIYKYNIENTAKTNFPYNLQLFQLYQIKAI